MSIETIGEATVRAVIEDLSEWDYISAPEAVPYKVRTAIERFQLLKPNEPIVVGVSGGPDSLSLLHILWRLRKRFGWEVTVAHLNHGLRGEEADADEMFVRKFCERLAIPCMTRKVDVNIIAKNYKLSVSQAGRRERYLLFAEVARQVGAREIALGHTANDVVETVILNLLRGTGTDGLQGIPPKSLLTFRNGDERRMTEKCYIVRPLISCWRAETEVYAKIYQLHPRLDRSNLDLNSPRNWVRSVLLSMVQKNFAKANTAIWRLTELIREEVSFLNDLAQQKLNELADSIDSQSVIIFRDRFLSLPKALQRRVFRLMVERLVGQLNEVSLEHTESAIGLIERHHTDAYLNLPNYLLLSLKRGKIHLALTSTSASKLS